MRPRLICFALALCTLLVYLPVGRHSFVVYDDPDYLTENPVVQAGLTLTGVKWAFSTFHASNWHPLTWLSHMLDCECFGLDAGAHHIVNAVFHAINAGLLLTVLFRLTGALWPSAFVAALFAWHPLHVESVAWASERKDVLSTLFWLLTLWAYARYVDEADRRQKTGDRRQETEDRKLERERGKQKAETETKGLSHPLSSILHPLRSRTYLLALAFFALGLMSKPMLVTLPFTLLLLDYWPLRRFGTPLFISKLMPFVLEKWPFFMLSFVSCLITFLAQRTEAVVALEPYPLSWRLGNAAVSYCRYLLKTFWPLNLSIIYPLPHGWPWTTVAGCLALLVVLSWIIWRARKERPHLLVGWLWFLGTLVPVIGLVQVGGQAMADRYTYIPIIGIFLALTFEACSGLGDALLQHTLVRWSIILTAVLTLLACIGLTERQLRYWSDSQSLFVHAIAVTVENPLAHVDLGVALEEAGKQDEALQQYQTAVRLDPHLAQAHNNLANLLMNTGKLTEALDEYNEALRLKPTAPLVHENIGTVLVKRGRFDEALRHYEEATRLDSRDARPQYLIGKALLRQGRSAEAVLRFREALRLDPNHLQSMVYLARVLAADENPTVRNGPEAVGLAERANALVGTEQPFLLDTLAIAYAEAGRFDEARQAGQKALDRAKANGEEEAASALHQRLSLYLSQQAYREAFTNSQPETMVR